MKICFLVLAFAISASVHCIPIQTVTESPDDSAANSSPFWYKWLTQPVNLTVEQTKKLSELFKQPELNDSAANSLPYWHEELGIASETLRQLFKQLELNDSAANSLPYWYEGLGIPRPINVTWDAFKIVSEIFKQLELNDSAANSLPYWYEGLGVARPINLTVDGFKIVSEIFKQLELNDSAANSSPYWFGPFWINDPLPLGPAIITEGILPPVFNISELKDSAANSLPYWIGPLGPDIEEKNLTVKAITEISQLFKQPELNGSAANSMPYWVGPFWYPDPVSTTVTTVIAVAAVSSLFPYKFKYEEHKSHKPAPHKVKPRKPKITTTTTTTPKPTTTTTTTTTSKPTTTTTTTTSKPTTTTTTEPPPPPKPKVWVAVNDPASFEDAQRQCSITGAHLATPETPIEIRKIETIMAHVDKKSCAGEVWIGLRQVAETGNFTWVTGLPLGRFTYWTPEVSVEEGSCISQSLTNGTDVEWHKRTCSLNLCYICEFLL